MNDDVSCLDAGYGLNNLTEGQRDLYKVYSALLLQPSTSLSCEMLSSRSLTFNLNPELSWYILMEQIKCVYIRILFDYL